MVLFLFTAVLKEAQKVHWTNGKLQLPSKVMASAHGLRPVL